MHTAQCPFAGFPVDILASSQLLLNDVDLGCVFQSLRPLACLYADDAADDFGYALKQDERAGERNDHLEGVERRPIRSVVYMLVYEPGRPGEVPARIDQGHDAGEEEDDIQHKV